MPALTIHNFVVVGPPAKAKLRHDGLRLQRQRMDNDIVVQLYLDCDGVLADFDDAASRVLGMDRHVYQSQYGRQRYLELLENAQDFYGRLALKPDAMTLFDAVKDLNPVILTGVPEGEWARPQKLRWAEQHFPGTPLITVPQDQKRDYCKPGDILIDDNARYRSLWEAAGGNFVLHRTAAETLDELRRRFPSLRLGH